ncbi:4-hydroxy-3-methylbut-2-enyl diphosphate reductase [Patescibacteria group bacterium AH-259-L07]|nr:4-hydroxy-3-methylbut-2-enyl diphosphate reductase [Patescibacteria group bacterium AH-259-L07]
MQVKLAKPQGPCAGVDQAIEIAELARELYGPPIYVRHWIVHNRHAVEPLAQKGVIFVEEIKEIPRGSKVILSAHGVAPSVWKEARERNLEILDATCPLVTKVHLEVKLWAKEGYTIMLIGHKDHVEVIGTRGEAPDNVIVIESAKEAECITVPDPLKLAYVTQTTLNVDDTKEVVQMLKKRFPHIIGPQTSDICYATKNRQDAVKNLVKVSDVVYIVGSQEKSSNTKRLFEVATSCGIDTCFIDSAKDICKDQLKDKNVIGVSSGASTPKWVVQEVVDKLREFGAKDVEELQGIDEDITFASPALKRLRKEAERREKTWVF